MVESVEASRGLSLAEIDGQVRCAANDLSRSVFEQYSSSPEIGVAGMVTSSASKQESGMRHDVRRKLLSLSGLKEDEQLLLKNRMVATSVDAIYVYPTILKDPQNGLIDLQLFMGAKIPANITRMSDAIHSEHFIPELYFPSSNEYPLDIEYPAGYSYGQVGYVRPIAQQVISEKRETLRHDHTKSEEEVKSLLRDTLSPDVEKKGLITLVESTKVVVCPTAEIAEFRALYESLNINLISDASIKGFFEDRNGRRYIGEIQKYAGFDFMRKEPEDPRQNTGSNWLRTALAYLRYYTNSTTNLQSTSYVGA